MAEKPKFIFCPIGNGWIEITVEYNEITIIKSVSHVPIDSIRLCIEALIRLSKGSQIERLEWYLEPGYWIWHFIKAGDNLSLVLESEDAKETIQSTTNDILLQMYRSLRLLESRLEINGHNETWQWDFPHEKLNELELILKSHAF